MLSYLPEIYSNELLYSVLGRLGRHCGLLSPKRLLDDAFGNRNVRSGFFLQTDLGRLAANLPPPRGLTAHRLAMETTLLPYVTAYQPQKVRDWALAALSGENREAHALQVRLGLAASDVRLPSALRYCHFCRTEMLERHGELYWRREHQLPGVLICPVHGTPLADSLVILAHAGQHEFIPADESNCPADAAPSTWRDQPETVEMLRRIAKTSATLLTTPPSARSMDSWGKKIRHGLRLRGFGRGNSHIDQQALRDAYLAYFSPIMDILPGATPDTWLEAITRKHRKTFAPLRHILLDLLFETLPLLKSGNPFGRGPWPCRNPLADHHKQPTIIDCMLRERKGQTIGVFRCSCGYTYSTSPKPGSQIKILDRGPLFETLLHRLISIKTSLRGTAKALAVDPKTVLRYVTLHGLDTPWKARPGRAKLPPIERKAMRAAWADGHAAAPKLTRQQLRHSFPAVYTWLYRNDHNWLDAQPPPSIIPTFKKPRYDWSAIDTETAEYLRQEAVFLRAQTPPRQITRRALERALGQPDWLRKRLHKLPLCGIALAELTESINDFHHRRIIWAAAELRRQEQPIKVWRLRRLAALPSLCTPKIESLLNRLGNLPV